MGKRAKKIIVSPEQMDGIVGAMDTGEPGQWNKICKRCKNRFISTRVNAEYCSGSCKVLACLTRKVKHEEASKLPEKTIAECKAKLRAYENAHS